MAYQIRNNDLEFGTIRESGEALSELGSVWKVDTISRPGPEVAASDLEIWYIMLRSKNEDKKIVLSYPINLLDSDSHGEVEEKITRFLNEKLENGWPPMDLQLDHSSELSAKS